MSLEHFWQSRLADEVEEASSVFSLFLDGLRELKLELETKLRILRRALSIEKSRKIGRIDGRQAPTTPSEDSTMGQ